jgi:hypothetical protein
LRGDHGRFDTRRHVAEKCPVIEDQFAIVHEFVAPTRKECVPLAVRNSNRASIRSSEAPRSKTTRPGHFTFCGLGIVHSARMISGSGS